MQSETWTNSHCSPLGCGTKRSGVTLHSATYQTSIIFTNSSSFTVRPTSLHSKFSGLALLGCVMTGNDILILCERFILIELEEVIMCCTITDMFILTCIPYRFWCHLSIFRLKHKDLYRWN
jgi:hypothetical protein